MIANILNGGRVSGSGSVTSAAIPASATSHVFNQDLWRGQEGADVAALQRILAKLGFYQGDITGTFYDQTREAVIRFQIAHGIKATGYVAALINGAPDQSAPPIVPGSVRHGMPSPSTSL